ncbi:MAG: hypothetical protein K0R57_4023 [Paenibacillaceae bacterium]|jgi:predicted DCC family thiol-disulfide oxidoreductase YuxK|nr:hypothetical protein [Paenibacillaceae bacterium]
MSRRDRERLTLLYDAQCNLCLATVAKLRTLRTNAELAMVPLQTASPDMLPANVSMEELLKELHVVEEDGTVYRGAEAIVRIVRTIPALSWLAPLYGLPGLRRLAQVLYRLVARHRYRLFGRQDESCSNGLCLLHSGKTEGLTTNKDSKDKGDSS